MRVGPWVTLLGPGGVEYPGGLQVAHGSPLATFPGYGVSPPYQPDYHWCAQTAFWLVKASMAFTAAQKCLHAIS